jgi:phosphoribosyl 1,2-cyclic phosphate phosphodiesterase
VVRVVILGSGGSEGVPTLGGPEGRGDWGACDPANPRNRRTRASILVEHGATRILVDTSPDLRAQLLANGIGRVDHVVYTHAHGDHTHGIHELRALARAAGGRRLPVRADPRTAKRLGVAFGYIFEGGGGYPPVADLVPIEGPFTLGGVSVLPFAQEHGPGETTLGFRFGPIAYSTDARRLDEAAFAVLAGVTVWIVDCLADMPMPTHAHVDLALEWIARVGPKRAILTHMGRRLDYEALRQRCPPGVEPAYDGMVVEVAE